MATYGYTRVSTDIQAKEGESLEVQQASIAGYAMMKGFEIAQTFVERGVSGSLPLGDRPKGKALLAILKPKDRIITTKLDRMFRSSIDALTMLEHLKTLKVELHMLDLNGDVLNNGMSKMMFTIISAFAEAERDRIRERILEVKADQRSRGRYLGGIVPYGYTVEDRSVDPSKPELYLLPIPEKIKLLEQARKLQAEGKSLAAIVSLLPLSLSRAGLHRLLNHKD